MELKKLENSKHFTPTNRVRRFAAEVISGNSKCDSPFKLFSTPQTSLLKIKNPFDSPMIDRLHLPTCSPDLFAKSTPKKNENFKWSICDISKLNPADIEVIPSISNSHTPDPKLESLIQEKISSYFTDNSIVPSPFSQKPNVKIVSEQHDLVTTTRAEPDGFTIEEPKKNIIGRIIAEVEPEDIYSSDEDVQYIPEEEYYKKLFNFETESIQSSPPKSTGHSPIQLSPIRIMEAPQNSSFNLSGDRIRMEEFSLSPILSTTIDMDYRSMRTSISGCKLNFSIDLDADISAGNVVPDVLDGLSERDNTLRSCSPATTDYKENVSVMDDTQISWSEEFECQMDISAPQTPNTGLFTSQRKRLSDSFHSINEHFYETAGNAPSEDFKSSIFGKVSHDTGYDTVSVEIGSPSMDNLWKGTRLVASTPNKKREYFHLEV